MALIIKQWWLQWKNVDFLKKETFFLKCRLFSKWRQGNYILILSILWSPSAISSQKSPKAKMCFVFSVIYISILNMGAVAYSSTPIDLVLWTTAIDIHCLLHYDGHFLKALLHLTILICIIAIESFFAHYYNEQCFFAT